MFKVIVLLIRIAILLSIGEDIGMGFEEEDWAEIETDTNCPEPLSQPNLETSYQADAYSAPYNSASYNSAAFDPLERMQEQREANQEFLRQRDIRNRMFRRFFYK